MRAHTHTCKFNNSTKGIKKSTVNDHADSSGQRTWIMEGLSNKGKKEERKKLLVAKQIKIQNHKSQLYFGEYSVASQC